MSRSRKIHPNPTPSFRMGYPFLFILSFTILSIAAFLWFSLVYDYWHNETDSINARFFAYTVFILLALIASSLTIVTGSGARWHHVAYFLLYLPVVSIVIPVIGTAFCVYCLIQLSKPALPLLKFNTVVNRGSTRIPSKTPRIYQPVPLHRSNLPGMATLALCQRS